MTIVNWIPSEPEAYWQPRPAPPADAAAAAPQLAATDNEGQTIKGFGGCFNERGHVALSRLTKDDRGTALTALIGDDGCRFNHCRVSIGASDYAWASFSLAFRNPDGTVAIVFNNPFDQAHSVCVHAGADRYRLRLPPHSFHTLTVAR